MGNGMSQKASAAAHPYLVGEWDNCPTGLLRVCVYSPWGSLPSLVIAPGWFEGEWGVADVPLAELLERPRLFRAAALCVLEHASSSTPPELIDHVLAGLEARTAPQPDSH